MDFFAFIGLALLALSPIGDYLLVITSITRAHFDRKKRAQDKRDDLE